MRLVTERALCDSVFGVGVFVLNDMYSIVHVPARTSLGGPFKMGQNPKRKMARRGEGLGNKTRICSWRF